jgi:hypothetical protein
MSMELDERTLGFWCVELGHGNWLAHLTQDRDGELILTYRFRWYRDDKTFDSADERKWYTVRPRDRNKSKMIEVIREMFQKLCEANGHSGWELLKGERSFDEFLALLAEMPGISMKETTKSSLDEG